METQLLALRRQNPADVTSVLFELTTSKQSAPCKGSLMTPQTHSASPSQLPPSQKPWFGGEKEKKQKNPTPDSVNSKGNTRGKVPWIPIAKTHTTWKEERKENPIWDFKRKVEHAHTIPFGKGAQAGKCCSSSMLCSEKVLMVQPSCIITHKQERPCRTVGVF